MPATDNQSSSFGRSFLSLRRDHVHSTTDDITTTTTNAHDLELEAFQKRVADLFNDLSSTSNDDLLSILWIRKLLDTFLLCREEFRLLLLSNPKKVNGVGAGTGGGGGGGVLNRLILEFFERSVKALDLCNAVRDGIDQIRQWEKQLEIVLVALGPGHRTLGEGQFRRAKKALAEFAISMIDEKEAVGITSVFSHRNRSFGRNAGNSGKDNSRSSAKHTRSLSWSVSRSWSAAKQLQAIGSNIAPPRNNEIAATNGLSVPIYTMNTVLLFVMWSLVAAIPCQDRGIQTHFSIPKNFLWAAPVMSLYERIVDESKKKDRRDSNGLLKEIRLMEKSVRNLSELTDALQFPLEEEKETQVREGVKELAGICSLVNEGVEPLERLIREVFRRIVRNRTEGLDCVGQTAQQ